MALRTADEAGQEDAKAARRWPQVYGGLKDAILSHRLAPGTKLPEDELASIYSVSRAVIEPSVAALAAGRAKKEDIALLRAHLREEAVALKNGRDSDAIALSARF